MRSALSRGMTVRPSEIKSQETKKKLTSNDNNSDKPHQKHSIGMVSKQNGGLNIDFKLSQFLPGLQKHKPKLHIKYIKHLFLPIFCNFYDNKARRSKTGS